MAYTLNLNNGWARLGVALSVFWLLLSIALYFSIVGDILSDWPAWYVAWAEIIPFYKLVPLYDLETIGENSCMFSDGGCSYRIVFDTAGLIFFLFFPVLFIWVAGYLAAWVKVGFQFK